MRLILAFVAAAFGLAVVATSFAGASEALPRYKLKPGMTLKETMTKANRQINRTPGFSDADCWLYDGNARIGWRHGACVGTYNHAGTAYRFKLARTPISCSRERILFVIPGVKHETSTVKWTHLILDCKP
jgi:hypothetical protein